MGEFDKKRHDEFIMGIAFLVSGFNYFRNKNINED
jgi:hypothetical protein